MATSPQPAPPAAKPLPPGGASRAYNEALAKKFGLSDALYPAVTKQIEVVPFNRRSIKPFSYNGSICRLGDRILMAYRYHPTGTWATKLMMAELDSSFKVVKHKEIVIKGIGSQEDPHLFVHKDGLWISWVESDGPSHNWTCAVKYGLLKEDGKEWTIPHPYQPKYAANDGNGREKNWIFYSQGANITCQYQRYPDGVWLDLNGSEVVNTTTHPGKFFPWGQQKGGTVKLPFRDGWLSFWHSTLDNELNRSAVNNYTRRYFIGCDYASTKEFVQCKKPILFGSEADDLTPTERAGCRHYKSNVVFCSGAIAMPDGSFVLSVGINDSQVALLRVQEKDLNL